MAERGKPIPFDVRAQIKDGRVLGTVRQVAAVLGLSKTTVQKYKGKNGTK